MEYIEHVDPPQNDEGWLEYALQLLWSETDGYEHVSDRAALELTALRDRVAKLEDALLISGNILSDVKNFLEIEIKVCNGVGMEYELGLVESIDAFQDLHGETVEGLSEKHARGDE